MRRRKLSFALIMVMVMTIFPINTNLMTDLKAATTILKWNKNDTMDTSLNIVQNKAGDDDIFLECNMEVAGGYDLVYYLEDSRRTTVHFDQQYDQLKISYKVDEMSPALVISPITQSLLNTSFLDMDYSAAVPDWKFISNKLVGPSGGLEYTISKNASSVYSGVAFQIAGKEVIIKWDFQTNTLYYLMMGYNKGTILNVKYTQPSAQTQTLKILKALNSFEVRPTHLVPGVASNIETSPIPIPGTIAPGSKPGLEITFQQPQELDMVDWTYKSSNALLSTSDLNNLKAVVEVSDIASNDYLDFNFNLKEYEVLPNIATQGINELPLKTGVNSGVGYVYTYDAATDIGLYKIQIVKNKTTPLLFSQNEIIQWDALEASKIYNVHVDIQVQAGFSDYQFGSFIPVTKFAYTYTAYDIKRANMTEAYLDIVPYDVGSQDEVEYTILYSKVIKPVLDPDDDLWVKHYYSTQSSSENIFIPVPFKRDSSQDVYQVLINFAGTKLTSQVLNYRARDDLNVPPTTPRIDEIDNLYIVPSEDVTKTDPSKVQFDLVFTAPENRDAFELDTIFQNVNGNVNDDRIYYELLVNDVPSDTIANPYKVIKVFEAYKEGGIYKIRPYSAQNPLGTPESFTGTEKPSTSVNFLNGYNMINEMFRMDNIDIFTGNSWANVLDTVVNKNSPAEPYKVTDTNTDYHFEFPGINYVRLRALTLIDNKIGPSYLSIPQSLSLSLLKYDVPIPGGLSYSPLIKKTNLIEQVGITLNWHSVDIATYVEHMLNPIGKKINTNGVSYGVYFSTDQSALMDLDPERLTDAQYTAPSSNPIIDDDVDITDANLSKLRNGKIVYFDLTTANDLNTMLSAGIIGLDKNTNYYVRIVTKISVSDIIVNANPVEVRMSDASNMLSTTTPVITIPPNEGEMQPLSVANFQANFIDETFIGAKLSWDFPKEIIFAQNMYGFEVISIEDRSLPDAVSSNNIQLENLIGNSAVSGDHVEMWRILVEGTTAVLKKYVGNVWVNQPANLIKVGDNTIEIIDGSNTPNKVYYYYARTINVVGGTINSASTWQKDTLTTAPVKGPINLAVTYSSGYTFNPKTEGIIRFDAPIPFGSDLVNDYRMEIFVKGEDDDDYSNTKYPITYLIEKTDGEIGYTRLYYRMTGLKPGKAYSVKVRIEDRTKPMEQLPDGTQVFPKSSFSERIIVRTEFDQSEYDKEIKYQEYLDYFDMKVKEYSQGPYFILEKTTAKNVVKYRDNYGLGELQVNANGSYPLYVENVKTNVFYLPADFVEALNTSKVTLKISLGGQNMSIRPLSVGKGITKAINDQVTEIQKVGTTAVDYYLKITVDNSAHTGLINSKAPGSNLLDIKMEVVASTLIENTIDEQMVSELGTVIAWKRNLLRSELSTELNNGIDDKKMLLVAQTALNTVKTNFNFSSNLVLVNKLLTPTRPMTGIAKNMTLNLVPTQSSTTLQALKKVGTSWQLQSSTYVPETYSMETMDLTSYILTPQEITATSLGGMYTTDEVGVINKYQLQEIFNSSELSSGTISLQKYRMIPAFARMLGAPVGSNDAQYLKDKGISISTTNMYTDLTRAEVLYLHTLVFAKKNAITLSNAKILNYNMISDLSKVPEAYKNTLLIGANMGIYKLSNNMLSPDGKLTIKEFIGLLTKIDKGLNW